MSLMGTGFCVVSGVETIPSCRGSCRGVSLCECKYVFSMCCRKNALGMYFHTNFNDRKSVPAVDMVDMVHMAHMVHMVHMVHVVHMVDMVDMVHMVNMVVWLL